jgi:DNA-binding Lrp family transcriptional regulator
MAAKAFVLIETAVGKTREVYSALQKIDAVRSVDAVTGPYDVIIKIEGDDLDIIGELVIKKIHIIPGVIRTMTCLFIQVS